MSKVNFVSEFIAIMRYARDYSLTLRERMLWIALFYAANDRAVYNEHTQEYDWPDGFLQVSNSELNIYSSLDKRAVETLRTALQQRGILDYQPGIKNKRNPAYKMNYLTIGHQNVPNYAPSYETNVAPNAAPIPATHGARLGTKPHPSRSPYNKYRETNQLPSGGSQGMTFVDLNAPPVCSGFLPLPAKGG